MVYQSEKTKDISKRSLSRIEELGLSPTPENYELWFVYFSGSDPEVIRVVDLFLDRNDKSIDDDECYEIYQEVLGGLREERTVIQAGDRIHKTIQDINSVVQTTKDNAEQYNDSLEKVNEDLLEDKTPEEINSILQGVIGNTKEMIDRNNELESTLDQSTKVIEDMRRDLEIARKEAMTDALTGLANRKAFDSEIVHLVEEADKLEEYNFSMLMLDIDYFKTFNDTFGHQVGDQVLKLVSKTLKQVVKGRDTTVRYGGEEFVILLPETNILGGSKVAEILRREIEKKEVINRATGKKIAKITVSIGVVEYRKGEGVESIVARVDKNLYQAKKEGRNKVVPSAVQ